MDTTLLETQIHSLIESLDEIKPSADSFMEIMALRRLRSFAELSLHPTTSLSADASTADTLKALAESGALLQDQLDDLPDYEGLAWRKAQNALRNAITASEVLSYSLQTV